MHDDNPAAPMQEAVVDTLKSLIYEGLVRRNGQPKSPEVELHLWEEASALLAAHVSESVRETLIKELTWHLANLSYMMSYTAPKQPPILVNEYELAHARLAALENKKPS